MKLVMTVFLLSLVGVAFADDSSGLSQAKRERLIRFVNQAVSFVKEKGKAKAICEFNNPASKYWQKSRYVFAFVCNDGINDGFYLADPATPHYIFEQRANGAVTREFLKRLKTKNEIWYSYRWLDPDSERVEKKVSYVVKMRKEKLCVGSGDYL